MKDFKRQYRELSDEHREKISQATANKPKSAEHRLHISQAMKDYWQTVPHRPDTESGRLCQTMALKGNMTGYAGSS